ncbi:MAG: GumC family protein [Pseudomonadales bacterium]
MNAVEQSVAREDARDSDDDFIDVGHLFRVIMHRKWAILGLALAITVLTALVVFTTKPTYQATASIMLESQQANLVNVEDIYSVSASHIYQINSQFDILKSRDLAERVVRKLRLQNHPAFKNPDKTEEDEGAAPWYRFDFKSLLPASDDEPAPPLTEEAKNEALIQSVTSAVAAGLAVTPLDFSMIAHLKYNSTDRNLAAQIVNAIAQEFISGDLDVRLSGTVEATSWLNVRLEDLKAKLTESEQALQSFRDREGLVDVEGVTGLGNSDLRNLSQRLEDARKTRIEAQNIREEVKGMASATTDELMTLPAVLKHQLIRDLKQQQSATERKAAELGKRYGVKHPKMIAVQSDLNAATTELAAEVRKVVSGINREYDLALRNERELQSSWEASKTELQEFNRKEFELRGLQREVSTNLELYNVFFTRIKSVSETGGFEKPHARIIDKAIVPSSPIKPNKQRSMMLAMVIGLLLGCGCAVLLDVLDNTIKSPDDVQAKLAMPLLGSIPKIDTDKEGYFDQFWQQPQGQYAEALRTIRTGVVLSGLDDPAKVIVVTSTIPAEGKSTLVLNLGSALGQMERTLVIGGDLRRPSLAQRCGLPANTPGLGHLVAGTATLKECVTYLEDQKIYIMPAGIIVLNPLELISSSKFVQILDDLKEHYDRIVIDSAPVQLVSDAIVLGSYADSIIYVVKADSVSAPQVKKGLASLRASNQPITGVVLNQYDAKKASQYYYGGKYQHYADYYKSAEPEQG